jgi:predicted RNA-binding protein with RPS1 domain
MEIELKLLTTEKDEIQVMEKLLDLARRAKELGLSIKELELETEEDEEEKEIEEETVE